MHTTRTLFAALVAALTLTGTAVANEVISNDSLADILVEKGVITKEEAKKADKSNDGKLKFGALFFLNTTARDADTTTATGTTTTKTKGLAVDRAYLTAKYYFNDDWMMHLTTDMNRDINLAGKNQNIFLKYAYLEGKLVGKAVVLRLGQSHTPWVGYELGLWKHRYVATTMSNQYSFDTSSDLGIGLKGELADGLIGYFATATTGAGFDNGAGSTNGIDFNIRLGLYPIEGLTLDAQFSDGYKGTKTFSNSVDTAGRKFTFYQFMVTYGTDIFRLGGNYMNNKDTSKDGTNSTLHDGNVTSGLRANTVNGELKSVGFNVWGWVKLPGTDFGAFGRYENLQHEKAGVATKEKLDRFVAGLEYFPMKNIAFSLVADQTKLKNTSGNAANKDKDITYGLYSQVKF